MFQREVAERIVAAPGSKAYGRLSVLVQWRCTARILFDVNPSAFVAAAEGDLIPGAARSTRGSASRAIAHASSR
jgi:hypothetical protein